MTASLDDSEDVERRRTSLESCVSVVLSLILAESSSKLCDRNQNDRNAKAATEVF